MTESTDTDQSPIEQRLTEIEQQIAACFETLKEIGAAIKITSEAIASTRALLSSEGVFSRYCGFTI